MSHFLKKVEQNIKKNLTGFTLVELLVVITLIAILTTTAVFSLNISRQKTRDAVRKQDLQQIEIAMETYFDKNGNYPSFSQINNGKKIVFTDKNKFKLIEQAQAAAMVSCADMNECVCSSIASCGSAKVAKYESINLFPATSKLPKDPLNNDKYYYSFIKDGGAGYCFIASSLERENKSIFVSNKGSGYSFSGALYCPNWP